MFLRALAVAGIACLFLPSVSQAQSGTRGGFSPSPAIQSAPVQSAAPIQSAPSFSAPVQSFPQVAAPTYSAPSYSAPTQVYSSPQITSSYPVYSQPTYSSGTSSCYSQPVIYQQRSSYVPRRSHWTRRYSYPSYGFSGCGN